MNETSSNQLVPSAKRDIFMVFAERFNLDPARVADTLKATAFKSETEVTNEQMVALLIVADQYNLNPWTKEIFAFPDKKGGIVPVVSVDGWARIINERKELDGIEFIDSTEIVQIGKSKPCPNYIECVIYRKDRERPSKVREYIDECYRENSGPWNSHTKRMLRHKSLIQCARIAFGFGGIYDQDEAERIVEAGVIEGNATRVVEAAVIEGPRTIHHDVAPKQEDLAPQETQKPAESAQKAPAMQAGEPLAQKEGKPGPGAMRLIDKAIRDAGYVDADGLTSPPGALLTHLKIESLDDLSASQINEVFHWCKTTPKKA